MAGSEWKSEVRGELRRENWSLTGPNRIVKVVPVDDVVRLGAGGYITLARFLSGLTPSAIERELGLPINFLSRGACIYSLARFPNPTEYEYELTAKFPGGLAFAPAYSDPRYGTGSSKIHQWKIKHGVIIPVLDETAIKLMPNERFRLN